MDAEQTLQDMGFTEVEALLYCELARSGPATGYRLAGAVGKAPPNVYQALENLHQKGAALVDDSEARVFRAVPAAELLDALDRRFRERKTRAAEKLRGLGGQAADNRIYHVKTAPQVMERARAMLKQARETVLFDLFPLALAALRVPLEEAALRGVTVAGIGYGELPRLRGIEVYAHPWSAAGAAWPGQQVTIVADAREYMLALLSPDGKSVRHGVWSDSIYLSCLQHVGIACEIHVAATPRRQGDVIGKIGLLSVCPPGVRALTGVAAKGRKARTKKDRSA